MTRRAAHRERISELSRITRTRVRLLTPLLALLPFAQMAPACADVTSVFPVSPQTGQPMVDYIGDGWMDGSQLDQFDGLPWDAFHAVYTVTAVYTQAAKDSGHCLGQDATDLAHPVVVQWRCGWYGGTTTPDGTTEFPVGAQIPDWRLSPAGGLMLPVGGKSLMSSGWDLIDGAGGALRQATPTGPTTVPQPGSAYVNPPGTDSRGSLAIMKRGFTPVCESTGAPWGAAASCFTSAPADQRAHGSLPSTDKTGNLSYVSAVKQGLEGRAMPGQGAAYSVFTLTTGTTSHTFYITDDTTIRALLPFNVPVVVTQADCNRYGCVPGPSFSWRSDPGPRVKLWGAVDRARHVTITENWGSGPASLGGVLRTLDRVEVRDAVTKMLVYSGSTDYRSGMFGNLVFRLPAKAGHRLVVTHSGPYGEVTIPSSVTLTTL
ncbi:hypothetical protein EV189_2305 [Motilibacter rhizosphaerae]|uniref:Uncharacterized protein n=1 Tax=Motilibacter rhizosphaerae TaxID=598652 RepID=A0A4Q7NNS1_9ACTN|nr:hypothetical protein [Motilibacter rhizosphaerae]RZS86889.1 hypothetical protein EV189_2305 [Motilibacter rhizosphaerae]